MPGRPGKLRKGTGMRLGATRRRPARLPRTPAASTPLSPLACRRRPPSCARPSRRALPPPRSRRGTLGAREGGRPPWWDRWAASRWAAGGVARAWPADRAHCRARRPRWRPDPLPTALAARHEPRAGGGGARGGGARGAAGRRAACAPPAREAAPAAGRDVRVGRCEREDGVLGGLGALRRRAGRRGIRRAGARAGAPRLARGNGRRTTSPARRGAGPAGPRPPPGASVRAPPTLPPLPSSPPLRPPPRPRPCASCSKSRHRPPTVGRSSPTRACARASTRSGKC